MKNDDPKKTSENEKKLSNPETKKQINRLTQLVKSTYGMKVELESIKKHSTPTTIPDNFSSSTSTPVPTQSILNTKVFYGVFNKKYIKKVFQI